MTADEYNWELVEGAPPVSDRTAISQQRNANPKQAYGDRKVPLHLVPPTALIYMALAFREGARKYGAYNYREIDVEAMTYLGAALRHIQAVIDGEWIDPETGDAKVPHIGAAMASMGILADAYEGNHLIDNRPPAGPAARLLEEYKR